MLAAEQNENLLKHEMILNEADIYILSNEYLQAQQMLKTLLNINPAYPLANYKMARVMFLMNSINEGLLYLKKEQGTTKNSQLMVQKLYIKVINNVQPHLYA